MIIQTIDTLPKTGINLFLLRKDMDKYKKLINILKNKFKNPLIKSLSTLTEGQASSAMLAVDYLKKDQQFKNLPILFSACDLGVIYNEKLYMNILKNKKKFDLIVWTTNKINDAKLNPNMYGWVSSKNNEIDKVLVKKQPKIYQNYSLITGIFMFKNINIFEKCYKSLVLNQNKINGEFYMNSMIEEAIKLKLKCVNFLLDDYFSWGTPFELNTFNYWQSYFHKWKGHPYRIESDPFVSKTNQLVKKANEFDLI